MSAWTRRAFCPKCNWSCHAPHGDIFHCHSISQAGGCPNCGCAAWGSDMTKRIGTDDRPHWRIKKVRESKEIIGTTFFGLFNKYRYYWEEYKE